MNLKDRLVVNAFQMTKTDALNKGVCIKCKKPPEFYSDAGRREYSITGLCEYCWDDIFKEGEV
jgi:hypothetical protein